MTPHTGMAEVGWPLHIGPRGARGVLGIISGGLDEAASLAGAAHKLCKKAGWGKLAPRRQKGPKQSGNRTHVI